MRVLDRRDCVSARFVSTVKEKAGGIMKSAFLPLECCFDHFSYSRLQRNFQM